MAFGIESLVTLGVNDGEWSFDLASAVFVVFAVVTSGVASLFALLVFFRSRLRRRVGVLRLLVAVAVVAAVVLVGSVVDTEAVLDDAFALGKTRLGATDESSFISLLLILFFFF